MLEDRKNIRRITRGGINALRIFLIPIGSLVLAKVVISDNGHELWGEFIHVFIYLQFILSIVSWGNKEYLLRENSLRPAEIKQLWSINLSTRIPLLFIGFIVLFSFFPFEHALILSGILGCLYLINSLESIVLMKNATSQVAMIETLVFLLFLIAVVTIKLTSVSSILIFFLTYHFLRVLLQVVYFRKEIQFNFLSFKYDQLKAAFPFLLLGITGMLVSKVDLYIGDYYLTDENLSKYQLFITCMIQIQAVIGLIVMPFVKNIYRLNRESIDKLTLKFTFLTILLVLTLMPLTYLFLEFWYELNYTRIEYFLGGVYAFALGPALIIIHYLYGQRREKIVLIINSIGLLLNLIITLFLVQEFQSLGLIIGTTAAQIFILVAYLFIQKRVLLKAI